MKRNAQDARWSKQIRTRDNFTCQRCGTKHAENSFGLHAAHIFSRGIKRLRHDFRNGIALCYGCHRFIDSHAAEKEALARKILGDEEYERLRLEANTPTKSISREVG